MVDLGSRFDDATKGDNPDVLGVVAIVVNGNGNEIHTYITGRTNLDSSVAKPIDRNSIFPLASVTKLIASIGVLRLVQQGKLNLDDHQVIEKHLPELWEQPVITSPPDQPRTYAPRQGHITLRHLLTHSSGSGMDMMDPRLIQWRQERGERPMALTAGLPEAVSIPLLFQPGQGWVYGGGLDWAGLLISRVTGQTLGDCLRSEVFDVIGCDECIGFSRAALEKIGTIVQIVTKGPDNQLQEYPVPIQVSHRGGGGLFSSAENYVKILMDIISPSPKLLSNEMVDLLFTPQLGLDSPSLVALRQKAPQFAAMLGVSPTSISKLDINHSLGGLLLAEDGTELGRTTGTVAWGGAYGSTWFANREKGIAAFYGCEVLPPGAGVAAELVSLWRQEVLAHIGA